jgi:hypothetical protein
MKHLNGCVFKFPNYILTFFNASIVGGSFLLDTVQTNGVADNTIMV